MQKKKILLYPYMCILRDIYICIHKTSIYECRDLMQCQGQWQLGHSLARLPTCDDCNRRTKVA